MSFTKESKPDPEVGSRVQVLHPSTRGARVSGIFMGRVPIWESRFPAEHFPTSTTEEETWDSDATELKIRLDSGEIVYRESWWPEVQD